MRPSQIETHPQKDQIVADLLRGEKYGQVAKRYGVKETAVYRYLRGPVAGILAARTLATTPRGAEQLVRKRQEMARAAIDQGMTQVVQAEADRWLGYVQELSDASVQGVRKASSAVRAVTDQDGALRAVGADLAVLPPSVSAAARALELEGRATGRLDTGGPQVAVAIVMPRDD